MLPVGASATAGGAMSAAYLQLELQDEATQVDVSVAGRRVRGRLVHRVKTGQDQEPEPEPESSLGTDPPGPLLEPPEGGRLANVYLRSVQARRTSTTTRAGPRPPPNQPRLLLARVDDPGLRLRRQPDGFELSGRPSSESGRSERRLAVAFDGELYAVVIQPSESIREVLLRLRDRLALRYHVHIEELAGSTFAVRFSELLVPA